MKQLAPGDAFMLYTEGPNSPNQIASLGIYDPSTAPDGFSYDQFREFYRSRVHLGKAFRRRLVRVPFDWDDPWWVEDGNFDLDHHLHHVAVPPPGDWRQLAALVGKLHSGHLDMSRPPWESWLIEGIDDVPGVPKGSVAILLRVHHTAIDGVGGVELMSALFQFNPDDPPPDDPGDWQPETVPSNTELMARAAVANAVKPWRLLQGAARVLPRAIRLPGRIRSQEVQLPQLAVPSTPFNARVSPQRVFDAFDCNLGELRAIKSTVKGATVNDAVIAVCAGALRHYLSDLGELPDMSLAAVLPMSIRAADAKGQEGNHVAQLFVSMHTDIEDPRLRLEAITETTRIAKGSQPALGAHSLQQLSAVLPGALFGMALRANAELGIRGGRAALLNTQISNIPGPPIPLYCAGAKLIKMYSLGPVVTGAALIHTIMSYVDQVSFSFTSDRLAMPAPEDYAEALAVSFEELKAATL